MARMHDNSMSIASVLPGKAFRYHAPGERPIRAGRQRARARGGIAPLARPAHIPRVNAMPAPAGPEPTDCCI